MPSAPHASSSATTQKKKEFAATLEDLAKKLEHMESTIHLRVFAPKDGEILPGDRMHKEHWNYLCTAEKDGRDFCTAVNNGTGARPSLIIRDLYNFLAAPDFMGEHTHTDSLIAGNAEEFAQYIPKPQLITEVLEQTMMQLHEHLHNSREKSKQGKLSPNAIDACVLIDEGIRMQFEDFQAVLQRAAKDFAVRYSAEPQIGDKARKLLRDELKASSDHRGR